MGQILVARGDFLELAEICSEAKATWDAVCCTCMSRRRKSLVIVLKGLSG